MNNARQNDHHMSQKEPSTEQLLVNLQVGYYFSAFTVDKLWMGRVRLQSMVNPQRSCSYFGWLHSKDLSTSCMVSSRD